MMDSLLKRIEKNRKAHIRWLAMVLCLSMIVSLGTFAGFRKTAVAKTYTKEVLDCPYAQEGASPVAHVHNDDCYDGDTLVCTLPEREAHTHTEECFAEQRRLTCVLEENPGHQHSDTCYAAREEITCGLEENPGHVHNGTCFNDSGVLICTMAEGDGAHTHTADCFTTVYDLICDIPEGEGAHTHTDECYTTERVQVCGQEELPVHVHGPECIRTVEWNEGEDEPVVTDEPVESTIPEMPVSDPDADLESVEDWNREFENFELSGNWARDLVLVAATQQGRGESPNNFEAFLNDAGDAWVTHGYTRYGAWYGVPYAEEWSAMFVSFCLRYAGVPEENVPNNPTAAFMAESFQKGELFAGRDYVPAVGDLIFFDTIDDEITNIDHMGIVYHVDAEDGTINTVEGDRTDIVATFGYHLDDEQIVGYGILPQNPNYIPMEEENTEDELDGLIVMTTDEEQPEETTVTEEAAAPAVPMPAQSWERTAGGIKVSVEAPEGAFPENTTIAVTPVNGNRLKDTVSDAVSGEVLEVQAVDITFFDADGNEIEPAIPIRVTMTPAATQHAEEKTSVVHVDIAEQTAELIEQAAGTEFDNSEVVFDADAFTIYAIVYTYQVEYEYEVDGKTFTSSMPGAENMTLTQIVEGLGIVDEAEIETFVSKIASIASSNEEVAVVTENSEIRVLKDGEAKIVITMQDGAKFHIDVRAEGETSASNETATVSTKGDLYLPADAELKTEVLDEVQSESAIAAVEAKEATADSNAAAAETAYQVFDISLENVEADQYNGFQVEVKLPGGVVGKNFRLYHVHDGIVEELKLDNVDTDGETVLLESVSFVTPSFSEFVLSYTVDFEYEVDGKVYQFSMHGGESIRLSELVGALGILNGTNFTSVESFLSEIDHVEFTDPSLVMVSPVENDWELQSLQAFNSVEALQITMKNGDVITVKVTDAQYSHNLSDFIHPDDEDPVAFSFQVNGQEVSSDASNPTKVREGDAFQITLNLREVNGGIQFPDDDSWVTFDMSSFTDAFESMQSVGTFTITLNDEDENGNKLTVSGNQMVVENGILKIKWNTSDSNFNLLKSSGNAHVELKINGTLSGEEATVSFKTGLERYLDEDDSHDLNLSKSGQYNKETGRVDYTITVNSSGTNNDVTVKDKIDGTALEFDNESNITYTIYNKDHTVASNGTINASNNKEFEKNIGTLTNGQYAKITYSAKVKSENLTGSGTVEETKNTVSVPGKDPVVTDLDHRIDWTSIHKKSNGVTGTGNTKTVSWEIVANEEMIGSMGGKTITDTIGNNSKDVMHFINGIYVQKYDANGAVGEKVYVSFGTDDPNGKGVLVKTAATEHQGEKWVYTVPNNDAGHNYKYVITYDTEVNVSGNLSDIYVSNKSESEGKSDTGTTKVEPGDDRVVIEKEVVTGQNTNQQTTEWKVTINVPANGLSSAYLEDVLPHMNMGGKIYVDKVDLTSIDIQGLVQGEDKDITDNSSNTYNPSFRIDFKYQGDDGQWHAGLKGTGNRRNITVTYQTINDPNWLKDYLPGSGNDGHENTAKFYVGDQNVETRETVYPPYPTLAKKGTNAGTVVIQGIEYPVYRYEVTLYGVTKSDIINGVTITDVHDARLTYFDMLSYNPNYYDAPFTQVFYAEHRGQTATERPSFSDPIVDNAATGTLTITGDSNDFALNNGEPYKFYTVVYYMRAVNPSNLIKESIDNITEDGQPGRIVMNNTATWNSHEDDADVTFEYKGLEKGMANGNGRIVKYTLKVNPGAVQIGDNEYLTLTDSFENLSVDYSTIKVTKIDGSEFEEGSKPNVTWDYHGNEGTFTIPNATALMISYNARVVGDGVIHYKNTAILEDWKEIREDTRTFGSEGGGGAENFKIRIFKYASGHMESGLAGAIFELHDENDQPVHPFKKDNDGNFINELNTDQVITFTTGANGYVTVMLDSSETGIALAKDTVYYLVETNPPAGFEKDYIHYSFEISDNSDYDNKKGVYRYHNNDILKVSNKTEEGGLVLVKSLSGINTDHLTAEEQAKINNIPFTVTGKFRHVIVNELGDPIPDTSGNKQYEDDDAVTTRTYHYSDFEDGRLRIPPEELIVGEEYTVTEGDAYIEGYQLTTTYRVDGGETKTHGTGAGQVVQSDAVVFTSEDLTNGVSHRVTINNRYSTYSYDFTKVEQGTLETTGKIGEETMLLHGAEFTAYNAATGEAVKTYKTDSLGEFGVRFIDHCYDYNTLYYIWETKAPEGYEMLPESATGEYKDYTGALREKYYFYFSDPKSATLWTPDSGSVPAGKTAFDLSQGDASDSPIIENGKLEETTTKLEVRKEWKGLSPDGTPGNNISAERIAELHPEWVENGIPFYVYQVTRPDSAFTSADLKVIAKADIADPDHRQGVLYTTEENPTGEYKITYDSSRNFKWQGLVLEDLPSSRTLFGKTTYYGYYVVDKAEGFLAAYDYDGTKFENFTYQGESNYLGHLELWNVQEATELYVKKTLVGPEQETSRVSQIQFQIYRDAHDDETGDPEHNGWVLVKTNPETMSMTTNAEGEWAYRNDDGSLKAIAGLVKGEIYHVVETKVAPDDLPLSMWDVEVSDDNVFQGGEEATITNTYKGQYLSVKKEWDIEGDLPSNITIEVYRREKGTTAFAKWKEESLNQGNNWTKFWKSSEMDLGGKEWEYYVKEKTTGYYTQISATEDNPLEVSGTIVVKNSTKYDGEISVEKVWKNKNNEDLETEKVPNKVEVILQRAVASRIAKRLTINVTLTCNGNPTVITKTFYVPIDTTSVEWKVIASNIWAYDWNSWSVEGAYGSPTKQYDVPDPGINGTANLTTDSTVVYISANLYDAQGGISGISLIRDYGEVQLEVGDYSDVEGKEVTLTKPNWTYKWENLPTDAGNDQVYVYSVREISVDGEAPATAGFHVEVTGQDKNNGTVTITNTETDNGSLKLTKEVTVNGQATTTNLADGAYVFSIAGPDSETIVKYVQITVTSGKMSSYKVADGPDEPANWTSVRDSATFAADATSREAVVDGLAVGDYIIKETPVDGMTTTVSGGKDSQPATEGNSITVTVTAGETVAAEAKVTFINDKSPMTSFNFNKIWLGQTGDISKSADYQPWQNNITVAIGRRASGTVDPEFALEYTISAATDSFAPNIDKDQSKVPTGEGELSTLTLTGSSVGNVFNFKLPDNSLRKDNGSGTDWEYFVKEIQVENYAPPKYGTMDEDNKVGTITVAASDATDGGLIVNQTFGGYELPSTGGIGTTLFTALGGLMTATAGAILTMKSYRRRKLNA